MKFRHTVDQKIFKFDRKAFSGLCYLFLVSISFTDCLELRPPPITFTQTQTALEKQMIGEDKDLEKDGWLIASIKTSSSGTEEWKREESEDLTDPSLREEYISLQRTIAYTAPEIKRLKRQGWIGEKIDGSLGKTGAPQNDKENNDYNNPGGQKRIEELVNLVNDCRKKIKELKLNSEKKKLSDSHYKELEEHLNSEYYRSVDQGEYIEINKGKWIRKE